MRIGCLQFAPQVGQVNDNISKADAILDKADPEHLDLLVLPELALSGYNFSSLGHISPFLEYLESGISSLWAKNIALKHDCIVIAGYPEKVDLTDQWPADPEYYNSALIVDADGDVIGNYKKSHLYQTDETWALEGPSGFHSQHIPGLGTIALGICMDLNPHRFEAPWNAFEFSSFALTSGARLVIVTMAWLTPESAETFNKTPEEPDMKALMYWLGRLEPIIRADSTEEVIIIFANRCGSENEALYSGTSAVVGILSGEVRVYGILGRGQSDLLVVDTSDPPFAKLVYRPDGVEAAPTEVSEKHDHPDAKLKVSSQQPAVDTPSAAVPGNPSSDASAKRISDMNSSQIGHEYNHKPNRSYKRNDLTIRLPELGTSLYKPVGRNGGDFVGDSGHTRRRSGGDDTPQRKQQTQPGGPLAFDHHDFEHLSVNSEPSPSALLQASADYYHLDDTDRNHVHHVVRLAAPTHTADNIITETDAPRVDNQDAHNGWPSITAKWMADDDLELDYVENEDPGEPFHDPTGIIGQWVQMIQTPRKPPPRPQHQQEHAPWGTEYGGSSHDRAYAARGYSCSDDNSRPENYEAHARQNIQRNQRTAAYGSSQGNTYSICDEDNSLTYSEQVISSATGMSVLTDDHSHVIHSRGSSPIFFSPVLSETPLLLSVPSKPPRYGHEAELIDQSKYPSDSTSRQQIQPQLADWLGAVHTYSRGWQPEMNKERAVKHNPLHYEENSNTSRYRRTPRSSNAAYVSQHQLIEHDPPTLCPTHESRPGSRAQHRFSRRQNDSYSQARMMRSTWDESASRPLLQDDLHRATSRSQAGGSRTEQNWLGQDVQVNGSISAAPFGEIYGRGDTTPVAMILTSR
ncbi:hypothetical protein E4U21_007203 [Claviceps maximensis]|nr:hypothetical protein E4U21_007203 [Claviceps maximensis]